MEPDYDYDFDGETLVIYVIEAFFIIDLLPGVLSDILIQMPLPVAENIEKIEIVRRTEGDDT